jgi:NAD(P)-dependent dehydrogenase (short-subunit alcohol dehydrogenase family)
MGQPECDLSEAPRLAGKTILITGANSGIGKRTALALAKMGASLVLVCRNEKSAKEAIDEIVRKTGNNSIELIVADLLLQREVRRAASEFLSKNHSKLDVLINNAGSNFPSYQETEDDIEKTMALNYFAPFLLTNLLLDIVEKSVPSRIVNVSSVGHFGGHLDLNNLTKDRRMGAQGFAAYQRSKLAIVLFTYELARRLNGKSVTANCLHPGAVRTHIWAHAGAATPFTRLASLFMKSPEEGAKTTIYLASSPEVEGVSGKYFDDCKPKNSSKESYDEVLASRLWEESLKITGLVKATTI